MTDITLTLDHHEFYFAVRGFINGSHLSQDVFETIVFPAMRQMDDEFMNYLWWTLRRNHFDGYMREVESKDSAKSRKVFDAYNCGSVDYMHILAALHLRNRYLVKFEAKGTPDDETLHTAMCYRFQDAFRPLPKKGYDPEYNAGYNSFIPDEWVVSSEWVGYKAPVNEYVEANHLDWWKDISIYDNFKS